LVGLQALFYFFLSLVFFFICFSLLVLFYIRILWGSNISFEGLSGYHNFYVMDGFKFGVVLFIFREFMFFFRIFWFFFDSSLVPAQELGEVWSPVGLLLINPFGAPLLNTIILLRSGVTVTWAHYNLLIDKNMVSGLIITCFLALYFIFIQFIEYSSASFSLSDGVFGSIFFFINRFSWYPCILWRFIFIF